MSCPRPSSTKPVTIRLHLICDTDDCAGATPAPVPSSRLPRERWWQACQCPHCGCLRLPTAATT